MDCLGQGHFCNFFQQKNPTYFNVFGWSFLLTHMTLKWNQCLFFLYSLSLSVIISDSYLPMHLYHTILRRDSRHTQWNSTPNLGSKPSMSTWLPEPAQLKWLARLHNAWGVFTHTDRRWRGNDWQSLRRGSEGLSTSRDGRIMSVPGVSHCLTLFLMHKYQIEYIQCIVLLRA